MTAIETHASKTTLGDVRSILITLTLIALTYHTLSNYSFLQMDGGPRFRVDAVSVAFIGLLGVALLLPFARSIKIGQATIDLGPAIAEATKSVARIGTLSDIQSEFDVERDAVEILRAVDTDLRDLAVRAAELGGLTVGTKPSPYLISELERRGLLRTDLADAFRSVCRLTQTALRSTNPARSQAQSLHRLAMTVIAAFNEFDTNSQEDE